MRKRKYVVGVAGALALSVAVAGISQAGPLQSQSITETVVAPKLDKKTPGAITSSKTAVDTVYAQPQPFTGKATNTKVDFPKDWSFNPGTLPQCDPATIATATTEAAIATCGASQVGSGDATLNGPIPNFPAKVTAFNGTTPEGLPTVLLHSRTGAPLNSTSVLIGTLRPGPGGAYGKTLDVVVPILAGGFVITHFDTTIPKKQTIKKNKKKGKPAKFYIMAKCSKKSWSFQARSTYDTGATTTATSLATCSQKKAKKKKK